MLSVGMCARYQAAPKESHLMAVKRIFRYLWYYLCDVVYLETYTHERWYHLIWYLIWTLCVGMECQEISFIEDYVDALCLSLY
jgi:hypothetical protein